jgi:hypothetical protein
MIDPGRQDDALSQMVLVGHSMGGLVAKLQVSRSDDILWRSVANQPFDTIRATDEHRQRLATNLFFLPSPDISRVVFIGTPHRGSTDAQRAVAQLASVFVEPSMDQVSMYEQLVRDNPGVFSGDLAESIPTSIDVLNPDSPLLQAILVLPTHPRVRFYNIIGDARWSLADGPGDGVVAVTSAEYPGAVRERRVPAIHTRLTSDPEVIAEVVQILRSS